METKYSETLKQLLYIDKENGTLKTEDGTVYDRYELSLLQGMSDEQKRFTHEVKKNFRGRIIQ